MLLMRLGHGRWAEPRAISAADTVTEAQAFPAGASTAVLILPAAESMVSPYTQPAQERLLLPLGATEATVTMLLSTMVTGLSHCMVIAPV